MASSCDPLQKAPVHFSVIRHPKSPLHARWLVGMPLPPQSGQDPHLTAHPELNWPLGRLLLSSTRPSRGPAVVLPARWFTVTRECLGNTVRAGLGLIRRQIQTSAQCGGGGHAGGWEAQWEVTPNTPGLASYGSPRADPMLGLGKAGDRERRTVNPVPWPLREERSGSDRCPRVQRGGARPLDPAPRPGPTTCEIPPQLPEESSPAAPCSQPPPGLGAPPAPSQLSSFDSLAAGSFWERFLGAAFPSH